MRGHSEKAALSKPGGVLPRCPICRPLDLGLPASRTGRRKRFRASPAAVFRLNRRADPSQRPRLRRAVSLSDGTSRLVTASQPRPGGRAAPAPRLCLLPGAGSVSTRRGQVPGRPGASRVSPPRRHPRQGRPPPWPSGPDRKVAEKSGKWTGKSAASRSAGLVKKVESTPSKLVPSSLIPPSPRRPGLRRFSPGLPWQYPVFLGSGLGFRFIPLVQL